MVRLKRGQIVKFPYKGEIMTGKIIQVPHTKAPKDTSGEVYLISRDDFVTYQIERSVIIVADPVIVPADG